MTEVIEMTLSVSHQLQLLSDILSEQTADIDGSISEYQQIKRLIQSMMANNRITDEQLLQLLPEIYHYGLQGEAAQNIEEHITTNKDNINDWLKAIQNATTQ
ncbi:MAG TPA: YtzH-like family protein [Bacillota bacterium]|nr:YtzH-like family protein [Bacillota bacterium]